MLSIFAACTRFRPSSLFLIEASSFVRTCSTRNMSSMSIAEIARPPINRDMKVLDRSFFKARVQTSALTVFNPRDIQNVKSKLAASRDLLVATTMKPVRDDETTPGAKCIVLLPHIKANDTSTWSKNWSDLIENGSAKVRPFELVLTYDDWGMTDSLADLWNIDYDKLPHWNEPTHIQNILTYIQGGLMEMLWVSGTNPLVSLPNLPRTRDILTKPDLFLVVQDIFTTETTAIADVVLPAAAWGEKTGCFTNVDRTVHISHKAVEPPGEAKSDLEIWIDFARRMEFKDKDGQPLLKFSNSKEAFDNWRQSSKGVCTTLFSVQSAVLTVI